MNLGCSLNLIPIDSKNNQKYFNYNLDLAYLKYKELSKNYIVNEIYLKKINGKYEFDYYKYENYNNTNSQDLIEEYIKEDSLRKNDPIVIDLQNKMKNEFICNIENFRGIKLFIFNDLCFLTPFTTSIYIPHVLKINYKNTFLTHFLQNKNLNVDDFVIDYTNNENCLFINILRKRLNDLQNNNNKNEKEYGLGITFNGERGYLYTTIPTELIEQTLLELDLKSMGKEYFGGYYSEKESTIKNALINTNENDINFFKKNEDYIRGMSTQELILFFINHELKDYVSLPRIIIFENLMDLKENKIYKNKNLNFIEFDSIIKPNCDFIFDNNKYSLILQKYFKIDKNTINEKFINDKSYFTITKNNIYFFEIKSSIKDD